MGLFRVLFGATMSPRILAIVCTLSLCLLIGLCVVGVAYSPQHHLEYDQFLTIVLTAMAVMLAALAIIIGMAAIWGYSTITERAELAAQDAAKKKLDEMILNQNIEGMVKQVVAVQVMTATDQLFQDLAATGIVQGGTAAEVNPGAVAQPYPEGDEGQ